MIFGFCRSFLILAVFLLIGFSSSVTLAENGKIAGRVVDKATKEAVVSANIVLKGTSLGAASDIDGNFFVIGVRPGTYDVLVTCIGYRPVTITGVRVSVDLTTRLDVQLESSVFEQTAVTITAEQKMVQKDVTSTRKTVTRETLNELPGLENTVDIFKLQGGTFMDNLPQTLKLGDGTQLQVRDESVKDVHIRGGRGGEILFLIDGIPVTHPIYGGRSVLDLDVNAVEQVELLTGAFSAEYGQAQSGVVNITTRSGSDLTKGGAEYRTDNISFLGTSYKTDYLSVYVGGPEPISKYILPLLGVEVPGKLNYFLALNGSMTNTPYDNGRQRNKIDMFGFSLTERQDNISNISGKLNWEFTPQVRAVIAYNGSFKDWTDFDWLWKYNPNNLPGYKRDNNNLSMSFNHVLSPSTFYTISLGYLGVNLLGAYNNMNPSDYWTFYRNGNAYNYDEWKSLSGNYSFVPDSVKNGIMAPQVDQLTGFYDSRGFNTIWRDDKTSTFTFKSDFTSQVDNEHLLKTGIEVQYNDISYIDIQHGGIQFSDFGEWAFRRDTTTAAPLAPIGPYPEFSQNRWVFHAYPWLGSFYLQDKFEKEFLIVNAGIRMDWFYLGQSIDNPGWKQQWEDATGLQSDWKSFKYAFSPRFGISFPITERTVLFFSYGHFFQLPEMQYFYRDPYSGGTTGNPHLTYEQTILYEFGMTHQFSDDFAVDIKSYAKDISEQVGTTQLKAALGIPVALFDNKSYGRARGLEFEFTKRYSDFWSGKLTYTVQWADVYSSSAFEDYIKSLNDFPYPIRERRAGWDVRHQIIFTASLLSPPGKPIEIFGFELPDDWSLTMLSRFSTGQAYTPFTMDPAEQQKLENTYTGPSYSSTDIKFSKGFTTWGIRLSFELDIFNLFDQNNIQIGYGFNTATGEPFKYGDLMPGTKQLYDWYTMYRMMDPRQYTTGRYVKAGLRIEF